MEVVAPKKNDFTDVYQSGDIFRAWDELYYLLTEFDGKWSLVSMNGDAGDDFITATQTSKDVKSWVCDCLYDFVRYPKGRYQLVLHDKDME